VAIQDYLHNLYQLHTQVLVMPLDTLDPPKSPLKRGTLNLVPPFLRGARRDRMQSIKFQTYLYTVAQEL
jgi:hypothetical protein